MNVTLVGIAGALLYIAGALIHAKLVADGKTTSRPVQFIGALALVAHGCTAAALILAPTGVSFGIANVACLMFAVMTAFVLLATLWLPVGNLLLFLSPLAALSILVAVFGEPAAAARAGMSPALSTHILISVAAYSVLMLAALQSMLLAYLEHALKSKHTVGLARLLPPLETMENLLFYFLWAGLIGLTLAIATGFVFLEDMFEQRIVHHTVLTSAAWVAYAALLTGHLMLGWRGTTAVRWTLVASALLLLGYFGSKFVVEVILERA